MIERKAEEVAAVQRGEDAQGRRSGIRVSAPSVGFHESAQSYAPGTGRISTPLEAAAVRVSRR